MLSEQIAENTSILSSKSARSVCSWIHEKRWVLFVLFGFSVANRFATDVVAANASQKHENVSNKVFHRPLTTQGGTPTAKYAYTWVIGGIDENSAYKGFLYGVLVSVNLLKKFGSKADFWLLTQLHHNTTLSQLPESDIHVLASLDINIFPLPLPTHSSFAQLVYEKFRPLQFTQYSRILFLDADTLPLVNLDYLFHLSDPAHGFPVLRPNLIIATRGEPCNTGMFMMHPEKGAWEDLQSIIREQHQTGQELPYPYFDWQKGWGHNFRAKGDEWEAINRNGTTWRYHAGHSDQGLWYYFAKYFKQDASIIIGNRLQTIAPGEDAEPAKKEFVNVLSEYAPKPIVYKFRCNLDPSIQDTGNKHWCNPVYQDFAHFMGSGKPWRKPPCRNCDLQTHSLSHTNYGTMSCTI